MRNAERRMTQDLNNTSLSEAERVAPVFFTIVSANYLAYAITLMQSVREHHPESLRYVFLADETQRDIKVDPELFELRSARDLPVPHFDHLAFRYSILEFNTALKPFAIKQLLGEHAQAPIVYIDPDILLLTPLKEVFRLLANGATAALTPHLTAPLEDGKMPDDLAISRVGSFNLGFIATGPNAARRDLVEWWCRKLEFNAYVDLEAGMFTDQKWMDLVPGLFPDVQILRHPGYNLAYWNLPHRPVSIATDGKLLAAGEEVAFVHFSGVDVNRPEIFSKHQNRYDIASIGALRGTYENYIRLLQTNGYDDYLSIPYRYGKLRDGTRITADMREIFARKFDIGRPDEVGDPFGIPGSTLQEPVPVSTGLMRWLRMQYPRLRNNWLVAGVLNHLSPDARRALRRFVIRSTQSPAARELQRQKERSPIGFPRQLEEGGQGAQANFIGYLKGEFGVAENARMFISAARSVGIELALTQVDASMTARQGDLRLAQDIAGVAKFPVNVVFANADQTPLVLASLGPEYRNRKYSVGYWFWELGSFPREWESSFECIDEVWVATDFVRDAVAGCTSKPVHKLRPPVRVHLDRPYRRSEFSIPEDRFVFLFSFDFNSFVDRKNPADLVAAFKLAFPDSDQRAMLFVKSTNGDKNPQGLESLRRLISGDTRIVLHDQFLTRDAMFGLESVADSYVSLHRAEGFGLGLAESMALGKPVIGTAYSGNMEFMNASNSCLVGYSLVDIEENQYPYGAGKQWADPDVEQAAFHMRRLVDDRGYASALGKAAAEYMRNEFSLEKCGQALASRLAAISRTMASD